MDKMNRRAKIDTHRMSWYCHIIVSLLKATLFFKASILKVFLFSKILCFKHHLHMLKMIQFLNVIFQGHIKNAFSSPKIAF